MQQVKIYKTRNTKILRGWPAAASAAIHGACVKAGGNKEFQSMAVDRWRWVRRMKRRTQMRGKDEEDEDGE